MRLPHPSEHPGHTLLGLLLVLVLLAAAVIACSRPAPLMPLRESVVWNLHESERFYAGQQPILDLGFIPPGTSLACLGWKSPAGLLWSSEASGGRLSISEGGLPLRAMALGLGGRLAAFGGDFPAIVIWDVTARKELDRVPCTPGLGAVESLAFSPDGDLLAVSRSTGRLEVVNAATGHRLSLCERRWDYPPRAIFLPGRGEILTFGTLDRRPALVEPSTGAVSRSLPDIGGAVAFAMASPDGKVLLTASDDRTLRTWALPSLEPRGGIAGFTHTLISLAAQPGGQMLAAGDEAGNILLLDLAEGREVGRGRVEGQRAWSLAWDDTGRVLASGTDHGLVQLWSVALAGE